MQYSMQQKWSLKFPTNKLILTWDAMDGCELFKSLRFISKRFCEIQQVLINPSQLYRDFLRGHLLTMCIVSIVSYKNPMVVFKNHLTDCAHGTWYHGTSCTS